MIKRKLLFYVLTVFLFLCTAAYGEDRQEMRRSFTVNPGASITLKNISGNITISSWDGSQVEMIAVKTGDAGDFDKVEISIDARASRLDIKSDYPRRGNANVSVQYDLKVPRNVVLDSIESVSGSIEITGIDGRVTAQTVSGAISASLINRDVELRSVSGRIHVSDIAGRSLIKTVSGRILIDNSLSSETNLIAEAVSGGVQFNGRLNPDGRYTINSMSGAIVLNLPAGSNFVVNASTFSGSIKSDFDISDSATRENESARNRKDAPRTALMGVVGSGGPTVTLKTFSGTIRIQKNK